MIVVLMYFTIDGFRNELSSLWVDMFPRDGRSDHFLYISEVPSASSELGDSEFSSLHVGGSGMSCLRIYEKS